MSKLEPIIDRDPFAEVDPETVARMAQLRDHVPPPVNAEAEALKLELKKAKADTEKAIAKIAVLKAQSSGVSHVNPDGSLTLMVTINQDIALSLSPWEELEGLNLEETARKYIPIALEAYINGM